MLALLSLVALAQTPTATELSRARQKAAQAAVLAKIGKHAEAQNLLSGALTTLDRAGNQTEAALAHAQKADLHRSHGKLDDARQEYDQAIARLTSPTALPPVLVQRGDLERVSGDPGLAIEFYRRALLSKPKQPEVLTNLGKAQSATGDHAASERSFVDAAAQYRQAGNARAEADASLLLAQARLRQGRVGVAKSTIWPNLLFHAVAGTAPGQATGLTTLAKAVQQDPSPNAARVGVFLAKQGLTVSPGGARFEAGDDDPYATLVDNLVRQGREAEVLPVLAQRRKNEQLALGTTSKLAAPPKNCDACSTTIPLTEEEQQAGAAWARLVLRVAPLVKQRNALRAIAQPTAQQQEQLARTESALATEYDAFMLELANVLSQASLTQAKAFLAQRRLLRQLGQTVAIYTAQTEQRLYVIVLSADDKRTFVIDEPLAQADVDVRALRAALNSNDLAALQVASARVYHVLIEPLEEHLRTLAPTTIAWSLDGPLRYVPIGALWDGSKWLVERYEHALITPESWSRLVEPPATDSTILAAGVSRPLEDFSGLEGVREELDALVPRESQLLDETFTLARFKQRLQSGPWSVVHLATHYAFAPAAAPEARSFLLLGDGSHLTLQEFSKLDLTNVGMLTLSACETALAATGSTPSALAGVEVDGIASVAQQQGAATVVATLWRIADSSAPAFIREFHRRRGQGHSRAAALRESQLAMLRGELTPTTWRDASDAGVEADGGTRGVTPHSPTAGTLTWTHPNHWAPFILIGNWR